MNKNRSKVEKFIIDNITKIAGSKNKELYVNLFKSMSNKEFDNFMNDLKNGKISLSIIASNTDKRVLSVGKNIKIAKSLGYDFFQQLKITGNKKIPDYITPNKYLVVNLPVRRASQLLTKKISIPTDDKSIDLTTGQVTGKSKGSKLTMPEIQVLVGMGMKDSVVELMKIRGGDLGSKNAMSSLLMKQGSVSQKVLEQYGTGVVSTRTLKSYWNAMHLKNNV